MSLMSLYFHDVYMALNSCSCGWMLLCNMKDNILSVNPNINVKKKVTLHLKITNDKKAGLISLNLKPNVFPIYLKHILEKSLD
jgi:hypothetical protein